jgi:hypothetical protein
MAPPPPTAWGSPVALMAPMPGMADFTRAKPKHTLARTRGECLIRAGGHKRIDHGRVFGALLQKAAMRG